MKNLKINNRFLYVLLTLALFTGCADVTSIEACATIDSYGVWGGLWHGFIVGFSFIGSLFSDDIAIYAINNTGGWYDFGFVLGLGGISSTSVSFKTRKKK